MIFTTIISAFITAFIGLGIASILGLTIGWLIRQSKTAYWKDLFNIKERTASKLKQDFKASNNKLEFVKGELKNLKTQVIDWKGEKEKQELKHVEKAEQLHKVEQDALQVSLNFKHEKENVAKYKAMLESEKQEIATQKAQWDLEKTAQNATIKELQSKYENTLDKVDTLAKDFENATSQVDELNKNLGQSNSEFENANNELQSKLNNATNQVEDLTKNLMEATAELKNAEGKKLNTMENLANSKNENARIKEAIDAQEVVMHNLSNVAAAEKADLNDKVKDLTAAIANAKNENAKSDQSLNQLKNEMIAMQKMKANEVMIAQKEIVKLKHKLKVTDAASKDNERKLMDQITDMEEMKITQKFEKEQAGIIINDLKKAVEAEGGTVFSPSNFINDIFANNDDSKNAVDNAISNNGAAISEHFDSKNSNEVNNAASENTKNNADEPNEKSSTEFLEYLNTDESKTNSKESKLVNSELVEGVEMNMDDLTKINGIGKSTAQQLNKFGIYQYKTLADLDVDSNSELVETLFLPKGIEQINDWKMQANQMLNQTLVKA